MSRLSGGTIFMVHLTRGPPQGGVIQILPNPGRVRQLPALLLKYLARFCPFPRWSGLCKTRGQGVGRGSSPELRNLWQRQGLPPHPLCAPSLHSAWLCMWLMVPDPDELSSLASRSPSSALAQGGVCVMRLLLPTPQ